MKKYLSLLILATGFAALWLQPTTAQEKTKDDAKKIVIGTIERFDPRFDKLIPKDAQLEQIADSVVLFQSATVSMGVPKEEGLEKSPTKFIFTEGVVWYQPQNCLLFSDIPYNHIVKWQEGKGTTEFLRPSGYIEAKPRPPMRANGKDRDEPGANGLFVDAKGRLYLAEHGGRQVSRIDQDGKKTVLADKYEGKRLNSPNDVCVHPNGDVYFTDPPYGLLDKLTDPGRELSFMGVFRINAKDGKLSLVSDKLNPNGIILSPDAKKLYVTNGNSWSYFPVNEDGSTGEGKLFVDPKNWPVKVGGGLDGMDVDNQGNIYATIPNGLAVMAPDGTLLGVFRTGDGVSNVCFGGEDGSTLFLCVNRRIAKCKTTTKGAWLGGS